MRQKLAFNSICFISPSTSGVCSTTSSKAGESRTYCNFYLSSLKKKQHLSKAHDKPNCIDFVFASKSNIHIMSLLPSFHFMSSEQILSPDYLPIRSDKVETFLPCLKVSSVSGRDSIQIQILKFYH